MNDSCRSALHTFSLRMRIGFVGLLLTLGIVLLGYLTTIGHFSDTQLPWAVAAVTCAVASLLWFRDSGTLHCVEAELRRIASPSHNWKDARKIVDGNTVAVGWNALLDQVATVHEPIEPARTLAALDDEAITLARAMRDLPCAWVITDREGHIRNAGSSAAALFAVNDRRELFDRDLMSLIGLRDAVPSAANETAAPPERAESSADNDQRRVTLTRLLSSVRMLTVRREATIAGRLLNLRISRSPLAGRSGDGEGMIWIIEDITQQSLATKSRDQFLMTATHELRTPLANLMAYAETLATSADIDVEQQKEFCNVLHSEASRLSRLVDHLLSVGQMEVGSLVIAQADVDLAMVVNDAVENLRAQAEAKSHTIEVEISPKLPQARGDRDKLNAVIVNLVGNAIKYTPDGGQIGVRAFADESTICVEVRDSGLGIAEAELPRIFEQFFRGTNPSVIAETGNGLGLSFAREVARLHQGDIEVQSRIGEGSIFTLRLPIGGESRSGVRPL
ncbi:MAG: sensor histidine kinase [Planctomycetaceae bacterium]